MRSRSWTIGMAIAIVSLGGVIACGSSAPVPSVAPTGTPVAIVTPAPTVAPTPEPSPTFSGPVMDVVAKDNSFSVSALEATAGAAFEIRFDNQDAYNHAIYIAVGTERPADTSDLALVAHSAFRGDYIAEAKVTYHVAALPPGTYYFFCPPHVPMGGTLVVR